MNTDFNEMLADILADPKKILTEDIKEEDLLKLQKMMNPYSYAMPKTGDEIKVAAGSFTNLREEYLKKFLMTSLVGFMYRMYKEYEVPDTDRNWTPKPSSAEFPGLKELKIKIDQLQLLLDTACSDESNTELTLLTLLEFIRAGVDCEKYAHGLISKMTNKEKYTKKIQQLNGQRLTFPQDSAKSIIRNFLDLHLSYDPDKHIGPAGEPVEFNDETDPFRADFRTLKTTKPPVFEDHVKQTLLQCLDNEKLKKQVLDVLQNNDIEKVKVVELHSPARPACDNLPPKDVFRRWSYYTACNFDDLRIITESLYHEKPDLEWALILYDTFTGTPEEVEKKLEAFRDEHVDEVIADIRAINFGNWTLIGDFKENREKINIYNKHVDILRRIIEQHDKDKEIGAALMKNRVKYAKAKNIKEAGPDAPGLQDYIALNGSDYNPVLSKEEKLRLEATQGDLKAARELEIMDQNKQIISKFMDITKFRPLTDDEKTQLDAATRRLEQAREMIEVPDDAVQVDVWALDGKTGKMSKSKFYTLDEELPNK
uniref:9RL homolog protein n=1 Tax=Abalone asfa-like virus TaxID=2839893 RepID=A0A5K7Y367_9VIRU|nr:9RL homolog protein [Abalone asfa-like virus]BCY04568.1 hypothetical protein [Abalone asfa-like virus]